MKIYHDSNIVLESDHRLFAYELQASPSGWGIHGHGTKYPHFQNMIVLLHAIHDTSLQLL
jgi:hypothetical protein